MCILFQLSSYGGFLSYQVKSFGLPSEGMVLLDKKPEIIITVSFETVFCLSSNTHTMIFFFLLLDSYGKFCSYIVLNFL